MNLINAEITKLAVNTYVTTKISYANMLARLCEKLPGADVNVVTGALGLDSRIGAKYLKGAVSYGGPCFPRDNRAFALLASRIGAFSDLAEATDRFNRAQITALSDLVKSHLSGLRPRGSLASPAFESPAQQTINTIGILGLTYKPNTDVVEESFGLLLAQELSSANLEVIVFDPSTDASRTLTNYKNIRVAASAQECIAESKVVVLATPWPEFLALRPALWARPGYSMPRVVIDCWRALTHLEGVEGLRYIKLGFGLPRAGTQGLSAAHPVTASAN
jgi:UDPglucose 6-dehydrogenase